MSTAAFAASACRCRAASAEVGSLSTGASPVTIVVPSGASSMAGSAGAAAGAASPKPAPPCCCFFFFAFGLACSVRRLRETPIMTASAAQRGAAQTAGVAGVGARMPHSGPLYATATPVARPVATTTRRNLDILV